MAADTREPASFSAAEDVGFELDNIYGKYNSNPFDEDSMFMNFEFTK